MRAERLGASSRPALVRVARPLQATPAHGTEGAADSMELTCKAIAHGSLMGARGNSGVIMSQILRGITDRVDADSVGAEQLSAALTTAALVLAIWPSGRSGYTE